VIELELLDREARMIDRRIKAARFPAIKSLESFDFDAIPTLNKKLPFDEWTVAFGDERLTGALLDRLTYHVHILEMNARSYRLAQSRGRKDAKPKP
jgi:DNA replication protein DnaC